ncbi:MAG: sugar-transfer associated ATP-grasp domain-containing protein [Lachnospiraceae bacterium]|nr:sugar-transfer associated ATP-grasp domain-containing protein [Lachnospiraceae bacterium]
MIERIKYKYDIFMQYFIKLNDNKSINIFVKIRYMVGILLNYILFSANIEDYFEFRFYEKTLVEKKRYFTTKESIKFAEIVDDKEALYRLSSKTEMYKQIKKGVKREQLFTYEMSYEDFYQFCHKHGKFIYKPDRLDCGRGIEIWDCNCSIEYLYNKAKKTPAILDEMVIQHHLLQKLAPGSVNTIRILTIRMKNEIEIIAAALRMGSGESIVDNFSAGGLAATIDINNGIIKNCAYDSLGNSYKVHPFSNVVIQGFEIPNWDNILYFVKECAKEFPLNYVAWDVAVREADCVIIEANPHGMIHVIQLEDTMGRKKQYQDLLKKYQEES